MQHFRDIRKMTSSFALNLALGTIRSVLVMRILGPVLMGAWKSALLLSTIGDWAGLGVCRGETLEVPILDGQNNKQEANRIASAAGGFSVWLAIALFTAIYAVSFFVRESNLRLAMRCVAVVAAVCQPYYAVRNLASARHLFDVRSKETLLRTAIDFVAVILLAKLFGLVGFGAAYALPTAVATVYLQRHARLPFCLRPDRRRVKSLISCGLPYSLTESAFDCARRLDVFLMAVVLGPVFVGYYGVAFLIMDFAAVLAQRGVSETLSPYLLREFGRTGSPNDVAPFYEKPLRLFGYVLPPVLGVGTLVLPAGVRLALPQYVPGVPAAQITLWAVFFVALHGSMSSFFVAAKKIPAVLWLYAVLIPSGATAQYVVMKLGWGLTGAAWTTLTTLALVSFGELFIARQGMGHRVSRILPFLASLYFPFAAAAILKMLVSTLGLGAWLPQPFELIAEAILFILLYAPVLIAYENKFTMLRTIYQTI
jgi:O-antigen/teichoic acid export membrane protein